MVNLKTSKLGRGISLNGSSFINLCDMIRIYPIKRTYLSEKACKAIYLQLPNKRNKTYSKYSSHSPTQKINIACVHLYHPTAIISFQADELLECLHPTIKFYVLCVTDL